jgi:hypothetical protein
VFVDADLRWDPKMFLRLLSHDTKDIIAGAYPFKSAPQRFPVGKILPGGNVDDIKKGLLAVSYAPTGFMRIPRSVFEKLKSQQTTRGHKRPTHRYFERRYTVETYDGGDVTFCRKWISTGGKVFVDSRLVLEHIGEKRFSGCFLDYLAKPENKAVHTINSKDPVPEYKRNDVIRGSVEDVIQALEDGEEALEDFKLLAERWGNKPWAATPEFAELAWKMALTMPKGHTILECGSGITSIVLAVAARKYGYKHIILENNEVWRNVLESWFKKLGLNSEIVAAAYNHVKRWYNYEPKKANFILIDGPPRDIGADRYYPLRQPWAKGCAVLADDTRTIHGVNGQWNSLTLGGRLACAGTIPYNIEDFNNTKKESDLKPLQPTASKLPKVSRQLINHNTKEKENEQKTLQVQD